MVINRNYSKIKIKIKKVFERVKKKLCDKSFSFYILLINKCIYLLISVFTKTPLHYKMHFYSGFSIFWDISEHLLPLVISSPIKRMFFMPITLENTVGGRDNDLDYS